MKVSSFAGQAVDAGWCFFEIGISPARTRTGDWFPGMMNGHGAPRNSPTAMATTAYGIFLAQYHPITEIWQRKNHGGSMKITMFIHFGAGKHMKIASDRGISREQHLRSPKPRRQRPNVRISLEQICGMRSSAGFLMWLRSRSLVSMEKRVDKV